MASKKSPEEIAAMRRSGIILAETINRLEESVRPGVTSAELDAVAARSISEEGDIVSLDVGVFYEGWHSDSAWTFPVGEVDAAAHDLLKVTEASLDAAIEQCGPGKHLGDVGHAVDQTATSAGFSVVREYAGHGIGRQLHENLWVPNFGPPGRRELLVAGVTLAVEPMVNLGGPETKTLADGWTVVTADGSLSAHFEHTIAITPDGCEVLTRREAR